MNESIERLENAIDRLDSWIQHARQNLDQQIYGQNDTAQIRQWLELKAELSEDRDKLVALLSKVNKPIDVLTQTKESLRQELMRQVEEVGTDEVTFTVSFTRSIMDQFIGDMLTRHGISDLALCLAAQLFCDLQKWCGDWSYGSFKIETLQFGDRSPSVLDGTKITNQ